MCGGEVIDGCCTAAGLRGKNPDCLQTALAKLEADSQAARDAGALYDGRAAAACVGAWRSFFASCPSPEAQITPAAGARVYVGGRTLPGSVCTNPWECARVPDGTAACLSLQASGRPGSVCGVIVPGAEGDPCNVDSARLVVCGPGLHCDPNRSVCTRPLGL